MNAVMSAHCALRLRLDGSLGAPGASGTVATTAESNEELVCLLVDDLLCQIEVGKGVHRVQERHVVALAMAHSQSIVNLTSCLHSTVG